MSFKEGSFKVYLGLGRAPAVALAYMFWCRDWTLEAANSRLQKVRPCGPKLNAIRQATCDLVYGANLNQIKLQVTATPSASVMVMSFLVLFVSYFILYF